MEAKGELKAFIEKLKHKKLILIIDELDRCRPDYAVKVLETIKHFFDIDGLFVVLPINEIRLTKYINGFYNIEDNKDDEKYLHKFINDTIPIPDIDYKKIASNEIIADKFTNKYINTTNNPNAYNGIETLRQWFAKYAKDARLTYREMKNLISEMINICNHMNEPVRCRLLAHRICVKLSKIDQINSGTEWCYRSPRNCVGVKLTHELENNNHIEIINIHHEYNFLSQNRYLQLLSDEFQMALYTLYSATSKLDKTEKYRNHIASLGNKIKKLSLKDVAVPLYRHLVENIYNKIIEKIDKYNQDLETLKNYGSDDQDMERLKRYDEYVNDQTKIFAAKV